VPVPSDTSPAVCILDDDPSVLRATGRLAISAGWKAELFDDPEAFLSYARSNQPRVAVVDVEMPRLNGLQVQERLREVSPCTCVIFVSSVADPAVRERAIKAGAAAYYLKPMDGEDLLSAIAAVCGVRRGHPPENTMAPRM